VTSPRDSFTDELTERLRALHSDAPEGDFRASLHRKLVAAGPPPRPIVLHRLGNWVRERAPWFWPLTGLATGLATFGLATLLHGTPSIPQGQGAFVAAERQGEIKPRYTVPSSKVAVIRLSFSAAVDIEDVNFEVKLPEGLSFWNRGERLAEHSFRWPGRLAAGENQFPIAVRGERPGLYHVTARAELGGEVVEQEILLEVRADA
jgi:hypothetical protein